MDKDFLYTPLLVTLTMMVMLITPGLGHAQSAQAEEQNAPGTDHVSLVRLARQGQFDVLLNRLNNRYPDPQTLNLPDMQELIGELQRYQTHHQQNTSERREAYQAALKKVKKRFDAGRYEDAMVAAIEAHDLADKPKQFLQMPSIKKLVLKTEAAAKQARQDTDWVESLTLYRLLHLLHDEENQYREEVKRARRHVRVLGLYAPKELRKLYERQADRREAAKAEEQDDNQSEDKTKAQDRSQDANDTSRDQSNTTNSHAEDEDEDSKADDQSPHDEPGQLNGMGQSQMPRAQTDTWQKRLQGVKQPMLEKTLRWAAAKHVDQDGYKPLLLGAIDGMEILLQTDGLEKAFPSLKQKQSVQRFQRYLDRTAAWLKRPDKQTNHVDAEAVIDRIMAMNKATVDLPDRVLIYEMAEGATDQLDKFTSVIWPYDLAQFARSTRGNFKGVGIKIRGSDLGIEVVSPLENTPAQKAGIRAGDIIVSVNGEDARTWSLNRAVNQITGPEGTEVSLGIERDGESLEFTMARAKIDIESIRGWKHRPGGGWNYWIDREDRIGYIRMSQFLPQTADDLDKAINRMQRQGTIHGLILDLRFNPGGLLESAIEVSDRFVKQGPIVSTVNGNGRQNHIERAHQLGTYNDFPLVVLINQGSASAAEIVSGALQDYDRALIVGHRSFGKGSVQDLFALGNQQARLKLTRQYYELPDGRIIHRQPGDTTWGIEPDLTVRMSDQQVAKSLELRQEADVLRFPSKDEDNAKQPDNTKDQAQDQDQDQDQAEADDILTEGVDPQLETALLILQTHLVADDIAKAEKNGDLDPNAQAKRPDDASKTSP